MRIGTLILIASLGLQYLGAPLFAQSAASGAVLPGDKAQAQSDAKKPKDPPDNGKDPKDPSNDRRSRRDRQNSDIKALTQKYNTQRDKYLAKEDKLLDELRAAAADQKDSIRAQIKAEREKWLEEQKDLQQQYRDRIRDMRNNLHNEEVGRVIDAAKGGDGRKGRP
jgi:hypothetical protein